MKGNEFFCEVDEDYIQDDFNLSGLPSQVPYYDYALELILDSEAAQEEILTEAQHAAVEAAAEVLYGLIHARYILTARGLATMADKFRSCDFGRCPRVLCNGQPCLPVGLSDIPRQSTVKLFCPRCNEAYYPRSKHHGNIDGAYFGTTFPHLFLMTYPQYRPQRPPESYVPRVFGFKISSLAYQKPGASTSTLTDLKEANKEEAAMPPHSGMEKESLEERKAENERQEGNNPSRGATQEKMHCEQAAGVQIRPNGDISRSKENDCHGSIRKSTSGSTENVFSKAQQPSGKKSKQT